MTKLQQVAAVKNKGMDSDTHGHEIGMGKPIERRDFLAGRPSSLR